jgi:hypothetical protein
MLSAAKHETAAALRQNTQLSGATPAQAVATPNCSAHAGHWIQAASAPQKRSQSLSFLHDTQPDVWTSPTAQYEALPVVVKQSPFSSALLVQGVPAMSPGPAAQNPSGPASQEPTATLCP